MLGIPKFMLKTKTQMTFLLEENANFKSTTLRGGYWAKNSRRIVKF